MGLDTARMRLAAGPEVPALQQMLQEQEALSLQLEMRAAEEQVGASRGWEQ